MNENPGEMPNPLNPTPGSAPGSNDASLDANPSEQDAMMETIQSVGVTSSTDPMARPMEQAPSTPPEPPKKKNTGLIIGVIVGAVVLVCGIVAAVIILMNMNKGDAVARAMSKLVDGDIPANVAVDGSINIAPQDNDSPITNVKIDLKSEATTNSLINHTNASMAFSFKDADDVTLDFEEVYASNGDLFLKLDGVADAIEDLNSMTQGATLNEVEGIDATNCITDETGATNCVEEGVVEEGLTEEGLTDSTETSLVEPTSSDALASLSAFGGIFEVIDGQWLKVSVDELSQLSGGVEINEEASCFMNLADNIKNHNSILSKAYNDNPFISSTTENLTVAKKNNPIYKVKINNEALDNYTNELQKSSEMQDLFSCLGQKDATEESEETETALSELPDLYVEVDKDDNFTRLYFVTDYESDDEVFTVTADLEFSYPDNINVAEPTEYQNLSEVLQQIFMNMFDMPTSEDVVYEDTTLITE